MGQKYLKSVKRAIEIVKFVAERQGEGVTLKEIADAFEKTSSTILPFLNTLVAEDFLSLKNHLYKVSTGILELSYSVSSNLDLKDITRKYLEKLAHIWKGNSHLGIFMSNKVIYIDRVVNAPYGVTFPSIIGRSAPAYSTGLGKALMAFQEPELVKNYIETVPLVKKTPYTIVDRSKLFEEITAIKERGYSLDYKESNEGVGCVGVPIFNKKGHPVCAISISVPISKYHEKKDEMIEMMLEMSREISNFVENYER